MRHREAIAGMASPSTSQGGTPVAGTHGRKNFGKVATEPLPPDIIESQLARVSRHRATFATQDESRRLAKEGRLRSRHMCWVLVQAPRMR